MTRIILVLLSTLLFSPWILAGSQQTAELKHEPQAVAGFAKKVEKFAAKQGALAFIIARVGQPEKDLPKGIKFTHSALAVYSQITLSDGTSAKGYAIHNLYQKEDNAGRSSLVTDYPVDFFWGAESLKAGVIIPTYDLQLRLVEVINQGQNKLVHNPKYSLVSNPFNSKYQNCNEHLLDVINVAIYQTTDKPRLKRNAKAYFTPQRVRVGGLKLAMGSLFSDGIRLSDHKGKVRTTTFTSIGRYLKENGLVEQAMVITESESKPLDTI